MLDCEGVSQFDERFEALWNDMLSRSRVIGERSPGFLHWKFGRHPSGRIFVMGIFSRDRTIVSGYIASRFVRDSLEIIDFALPANKMDADTLLAAFIRHGRALKVDSISVNFMQNASHQRTFGRWGFFGGKGPHRNVYAFSADEFWQGVNRAEDWLLTQCDEDI